ncbi:hypothetical protein N431DRAFT_482911 [Stipitochalara longipes BDJ]|nr:hypothetical protein N431DRAFT_482911 [Stipitochalara longipes BDJ]
MSKELEIITFHPEDDSDLELNASLSLDIIAIHGLNGNQLNTWTEPKSQKLWLRDFLPKDVKARVMVFGYDATAAFGNGVAGIKEHARGLLGGLVERRGRNLEAKRPLIFIGHSLGGLVIKQALVIAEQEMPYKKIYNSTLGIIFFGTPHQGSSLANYATAITRTLLVLANKPNAELLESLRKGSPALKKLGDDWKTHHERRPYDVVSFYETRTMKGLRGLIVEKSSALLTPQDEIPTYENQIPVDATHREMCRFATPKDKTYRVAVRAIKSIQQGNEIKVTNEHYVVPHSASSHFTGRNDVQEQLHNSLLSYRTSKTQQRFVLHGLGGSGKTQIALKFAEDNRDRFWGIFWIDASSEDTAQEGFLSLALACKQEKHLQSFKVWLSRKDHWLLILDNVDNPDLDVSKFFLSGERGTILITTRNRDLRKYGTPGSYCTDKLCSKDAAALFLKTAAVENVQDEHVKEVADQIVNELGYLALAIIQAGAVIRQGICHLDGFCDVYAKQKREILEAGRCISSIEEYQYSVFTTWEISIEKIQAISDEHAKLALELLGMFSFMHFDSIRKDIFESAILNSTYAAEVPDFRGSLLARLMPEEWDNLLWGKAMKLLLAFSLITTSHSGLISMHPLVHLWSRERMLVAERARTWKTTLLTLSMSVTMYTPDERKRQLLLPHIDSLLEHNNGECSAPGVDNLKEGFRAVLYFHLAYTENGQYQKALGMARGHLKLIERILDPKDFIHLCLTCLHGQDLMLLGRYREAIEMLEPFMRELPENLPNDMALQTAACLASSYNCLGEYHTSLDLCTKTLSKLEGISTDEVAEIIDIYRMMGQTLSRLKKPEEALIWLKKAVCAAEKAYGIGHSRTLIVMEYLADTYGWSKDFQKACDWQEKCVNSRKASFGSCHLSTLHAEGRLLDFRAKRSRNVFSKQKVLGQRKALFEKISRQLGEEDWRTLSCQWQLSEDYFACGLFKKAIIMQEKCARVMIQEFGQEDKRTVALIAELEGIKRWERARKVVYWWLPQSFLK